MAHNRVKERVAQRDAEVARLSSESAQAHQRIEEAARERQQLAGDKRRLEAWLEAAEDRLSNATTARCSALEAERIASDKLSNMQGLLSKQEEEVSLEGEEGGM